MLGEDHLGTIITQTFLANRYTDTSRSDLARDLLVDAMQRVTAVHGPDHSQAAAVQRALLRLEQVPGDQ